MSSGEFSPQRRVPRYSFVAPAAVLPEKGAPIGGNIKELSLYGCYMDAQSTLAPRTKVLVKIFMPGEYFEANATVAYANPALGLGLVFRDVKPAFRSVLRKWLLMAMQLSQPSTLQGVTLDGIGDEAADSGESAEERSAGASGKKKPGEG
jgi:PilZ domain-containing protein